MRDLIVSILGSAFWMLFWGLLVHAIPGISWHIELVLDIAGLVPVLLWFRWCLRAGSVSPDPRRPVMTVFFRMNKPERVAGPGVSVVIPWGITRRDLPFQRQIILNFPKVEVHLPRTKEGDPEDLQTAWVTVSIRFSFPDPQERYRSLEEDDLDAGERIILQAIYRIPPHNLFTEEGVKYLNADTSAQVWAATQKAVQGKTFKEAQTTSAREEMAKVIKGTIARQLFSHWGIPVELITAEVARVFRSSEEDKSEAEHAMIIEKAEAELVAAGIAEETAVHKTAALSALAGAVGPWALRGADPNMVALRVLGGGSSGGDGGIADVVALLLKEKDKKEK